MKKLDNEQMQVLAAEIRHELVETVSKTGGHLAPNLGVVELTLGIERSLDCPRDVIAFDVGHQSYVHKLLTGRRDAFCTLRTLGGMSGFPKRSESPCDLYGSGHASDSISIALGYALARDAQNQNSEVVAVIGDGSLTGGMAWEALNHLGHTQTRMIVVLNDNEMSISKNVGALASYLGRIRLSKRYWGLRESLQSKLESQGAIGQTLLSAGKTLKDSVKQLMVPGMLFEEMGLRYVGPIDGHDIEQVQAAIESAKGSDGPVLIHAVTQKGRGYEPASSEPERFHGIGPFNRETGIVEPSTGPLKYTEVFSQALLKEAARNPRIHAITAAMAPGTGLNAFSERYPERFHDVGIAEEHAVGLAAGLAFGGQLPVVAIYSTFLQRAYDQIIGDVALQGAHVVFAIDRAGFVGDDGPTHHGLYDLSFLRSIPTMKIMAPRNEADLVDALHTALEIEGPVALRYPRGGGIGTALPEVASVWSVGSSLELRTGEDVAFLAVGRMVENALEAAKLLEANGISATVVDMRWVKPLDEAAILAAVDKHRLIVTVEENTVRGGFGSGVLEVLSDENVLCPVLHLGTPDEFCECGSMKQLIELAHLDPASIAEKTADRLERLDG
ncbi:MAG: 1-deoxy-D-xylulose-5-phosphate synthase [Coriobacteriia bacterium]|nr:1-deoxy-D-xylulose-5-phosphate synthase [Coriobacteriia bacterium]